MLVVSISKVGFNVALPNRFIISPRRPVFSSHWIPEKALRNVPFQPEFNEPRLGLLVAPISFPGYFSNVQAVRRNLLNTAASHPKLVAKSEFKENTMTQIEKVLYTARAHTTGGRDGGASRTSDGRLEVRLSVPGAAGTGTNPEQLFAVGWSACFLSAIKIVAARKKVRLPADVAVDAEVDLGTTGGGYLLQARLNVSLPGIEREIAQQLVDGAHLECPYSKATHGNINVVTNVVDTQAATHVA